ncbi:MAG: molybdate ABC transporter substrate-binding protein [Chloroflexi bacterium]|nr:molybdate ABC transporter substrate-binding protein [Chloroflexota bacterium]
MRSKFMSFLMLVVLLASAACSPQVTPAAPTAAPASAEATQAPEATVAPAEPTQAPVEPRTLTVLAAASLTESFTELGHMFEEQNPGVTVSFNFAGSQQLAQQLDQGAAADVFASANNKYMDAAVESQRVNAPDAQTFAKNRLVVIYPAGNPAGLSQLQDLAMPGLKLDLADETVPVGQYSVAFLDKASQDDAFGATFKDDVLSNVVSYEDNVKAVLTKVSLDEADAGIVYQTDITPDAADKVGTLEIPDELNTIATYPIAPIADSENPDLAQAFVELVLSPDGQALLGGFGFAPAVDSSAGEAGEITVTDALGRTVTFSEPPHKIVLAGKALFMVADAIYTFPEAGENITALGSTAQGSGNFIPMVDAGFSDKITLDSNAGPEQIAAAQPDCVILKSSNAKTLGAPLEELDIPVVYLDFETADQYWRDMETLGKLFQNPQRAAEVIAFYQDRVDSITQTLSGVTEDQKPRTLILYYNDKDGNVAFSVPPMGWMQTWIVQTAGGQPVWEDANPVDGWLKVSLEQVAAWNPDTIFVVAYFNPVNDVVAALKADPQWQALDAVQNDQVFGFAGDVYSWDQPDTRWILGLAWAAGKLHPDLFPDLDMAAEAQTFYQELYGMDEAGFQENVLPLFSGDIN